MIKCFGLRAKTKIYLIDASDEDLKAKGTKKMFHEKKTMFRSNST